MKLASSVNVSRLNLGNPAEGSGCSQVLTSRGGTQKKKNKRKIFHFYGRKGLGILLPFFALAILLLR